MNSRNKFNIVFTLFLFLCSSVTPSIEIKQITNSDTYFLDQAEEVFVKAFENAYKNISLETLTVTDLNAFLKNAFKDERTDLANSNKKLLCYIALYNNKVVGVIFFEPTEQKDEINVAQLAIDPSMQRLEIGSKCFLGSAQ